MGGSCGDSGGWGGGAWQVVLGGLWYRKLGTAVETWTHSCARRIGCVFYFFYLAEMKMCCTVIISVSQIRHGPSQKLWKEKLTKMRKRCGPGLEGREVRYDKNETLSSKLMLSRITNRPNTHLFNSGVENTNSFREREKESG